MTAIATRFQNPKSHGKALAGLSVLGLFSQLALHAFESTDVLFNVSGEQVLRALPLTSICELVACCLPAWAQIFGACPWLRLLETAFRLLYYAL